MDKVVGTIDANAAGVMVNKKVDEAEEKGTNTETEVDGEEKEASGRRDIPEATALQSIEVESPTLNCSCTLTTAPIPLVTVNHIFCVDPSFPSVIDLLRPGNTVATSAVVEMTTPMIVRAEV